MTPEELRETVRARLADEWPGVQVTLRIGPEDPPILAMGASLTLHVEVVGRTAGEPDEIDTTLFAHMLDMAIRSETQRRVLYADAQAAVEAAGG